MKYVESKKKDMKVEGRLLLDKRDGTTGGEGGRNVRESNGEKDMTKIYYIHV